MYYSDTGRKKLMSTSLPRKCMGWNKTEFHITNDNHAFVVKTPPGMSTALLSYRTIHLEELSIKLRNWNLFWVATFPNKQIAWCKKGINSHPSTNRFPFSTLLFKTRHVLLFEMLKFFLSQSLNISLQLKHPYPATASPSRFHTHLAS